MKTKKCLACGHEMSMDQDCCPKCHLAGQNQLFLSKEDYEKWERQVLRPHRLSLNPTQVFGGCRCSLALMGNGDLFEVKNGKTKRIAHGVKHAAVAADGLIVTVSFGGWVDFIGDVEHKFVRKFHCPFRVKRVFASEAALWIFLEDEKGRLYFAGRNRYTRMVKGPCSYVAGAEEWIYCPQPYYPNASDICSPEDAGCVFLDGLPYRHVLDVQPRAEDGKTQCNNSTVARLDGKGRLTISPRKPQNAPGMTLSGVQDFSLSYHPFSFKQGGDEENKQLLVAKEGGAVYWCSDEELLSAGDWGKLKKLEFFKYCPHCLSSVPRESDRCPGCGKTGLNDMLDTRKDWLAYAQNPPAFERKALLRGNSKHHELYFLKEDGRLYYYKGSTFNKIAEHVKDMQHGCYSNIWLMEDGRFCTDYHPFICSFPVERIQGLTLWDTHGKKKHVGGDCLSGAWDHATPPVPRPFDVLCGSTGGLQEEYKESLWEEEPLHKRYGFPLPGTVKFTWRSAGLFRSGYRVYYLDDQHVFHIMDERKNHKYNKLSGVADFAIIKRADDEIEIFVLNEKGELLQIAESALGNTGWSGLKKIQFAE